MTEKEERERCPISLVLDHLGDKWTLLIIRDMVFKGKMFYGEFADSPEGISTNILADRLLRLEKFEFITKERDEQNLRKNIYRLTKKGKDLVPILLEYVLWSSKYQKIDRGNSSIIDGAPKNLIRKMRKDKSKLVDEILQSL